MSYQRGNVGLPLNEDKDNALTDEEIFFQNLEIFEKQDEVVANYFFDLLAQLIINYKIDFNDTKFKFLVPVGKQFAFTVSLGKNILIGIKRNSEEVLLVSLLLPTKKAAAQYNLLSDFDGFEEKNLEKREYALTNFLLQNFRLEDHTDIKNDWFKVINEIIAGNPRLKKKDVSSFPFFSSIIDKSKRQDVFKQIPNQFSDRFKVEPDDEEAFEDYEFDPEQINISIEQKSLDSLIFRLEANKIDMAPIFQRHSGLWTKENMSRFIESILLGLPIPAFYFDATDNNKWIVVDGLQRLYSLYRFAVAQNKESLILNNLKILKRLNGCSYEQIPGEMRLRLKEYQVTFNLIKPVTPPNVKYSIFHRINTGGYRLNNQEIRHALNLWYKGDAAEGPNLLINLCETELFKSLIKISAKRMQDREIALRFIAFQIVNSQDYNASMRIYLDKGLEELNKQLKVNGKIYADALTDKFNNTLKRAHELLGENPFSRFLENESEIKFNRSLFDAWTFHLARLSEMQWNQLKIKREAVIEDYKKIFQDDDFDSSITSSTTSKINIVNRMNAVRTIIQKYVPDFKEKWSND